MATGLLIWLVWGVSRAALSESIADTTHVPSLTNHHSSLSLLSGAPNMTNMAETKSAPLSNTVRGKQHFTPCPPEDATMLTGSTQEKAGNVHHTGTTYNVSMATFDMASCECHNTDSFHPIKIKNYASGYILSHTSRRGPTCYVQLEVSHRKRLRFNIKTCKHCELKFDYKFYSLARFNCNEPLPTSVFYSVYGIVKLQIVPDFNIKLPLSLALHFSTVPDSDINNLELVHLSPSTGYVQTSGWDTCIPYIAEVRGEVTLTPPTDKVTFLTLPVDTYESITIKVPCDGQWKSKKFESLKLPLEFNACLCPDDFFRVKPREGISISIQYRSSINNFQRYGYAFFRARLRFSFHLDHFKPKRVASWVPHIRQRITWNCSMLSQTHLVHHFPCDVVPQCVDYEDEVHCPYVSEKCGLNQVHLGGKCYIFDFDQSSCNKYSGFSFLSLETYQKWNDVTNSMAQAGLLESIILRLWPITFISDLYPRPYDNRMYENLATWSSGSVAYYLDLRLFRRNHRGGGMLTLRKCPRPKRLFYDPLSTLGRYFLSNPGVVCEIPSLSDSHNIRKSLPLPIPGNCTQWPVPLITCAKEHLTHVVLACDPSSLCRSLHYDLEWYNNQCDISVGRPLQYFFCGDSGGFISYSLVCDVCQDCAEDTDEDFCLYLHRKTDSYEWCLGYKRETVHSDKYIYEQPIKPPASINFDGVGGFTVTPLPENTTHCPDTHFQCSDDRYCLPVYVMCNDVNDCPGHEDEAGCENYTCAGFYRCLGRNRTICVHVNHLCDGQPHCAHRDDELLCDINCPDSCSCYGIAFICTHTFHASSFLELRYLDAKGSRLEQADIVRNIMLIYLDVQACVWTNLTELALPNLHSLDIRDNLLQHVNFCHFVQMHYLQIVRLTGNPLSGLWYDMAQVHFPYLSVFNLSQIEMPSVDFNVLSAMLPKLKVLDLSHCMIQSLQGDNNFFNLRVLDLQGSDTIDFTPHFMRGMHRLTTVYASDFKICCAAVLPVLFEGECTAPHDEISSCSDLLKSGIYQLAVLLFSVLGVLGNVGSIIYRVRFSLERMKIGFSVFVLHLCVSDCLMGVYLALIGIADKIYAGVYVWEESKWRRSPACSFAGFLSFLSCEVSAFLIFLITLDRFVVLHFPFSHIRFRSTSAHIVCAVMWNAGCILAIIPLLPVTSHWGYYRQTGICIPLPVTRADFAGHTYSFSVMIVCNLILFLLIAVGQSLIFWTVKTSSMPEQSKQTKNKDGKMIKSKEFIIARRLLSIAISDFLCWFPIGLCGMLASADISIPGEVNVAMAVFVLPLNSALNPFIYTLNIVLEKRQHIQ